MLFIVYLGLLHLTTSLGDFMIYVLYSDQTNSNFVKDAKSNLYNTINQSEQFFEIEVKEMNFNQNLTDILDTTLNFMIIDATFSIYWNRIIYEYTENSKIINLILSLDFSHSGDWQFFLHNSVDQHTKNAELLIEFFGWSNLAIVTSESQANLKMASNIEKRLKNQVALKGVLPDSIIEENIGNFIGKIIKPAGIQMFLILVEGEHFQYLLEGLKNEKIYKKGAGILAGSTSIWANGEDGLTYYAEKGLETAQSYSEYEFLAIKQLTNIIIDYKLKYNSSQILDSLLIQQLFESKTYQHRKLPIFSIINIDSNERMIKGEVENSTFKIFNRTFVYPGNTTIFPKISESEIVLSVASGSTEPNGLPKNLLNPQNFLGTLYAQWVINNSTSLLNNFYINLFQTDCGTNTYDFNFYYDCMNSSKSQLGVAFLSPSFSAGAVGYVSVFRKLDLEIPHLGAGTRVVTLSNKTQYPEYMRITTSAEYFAVILAKGIAYFGWNNIAVIYGNKSSIIPVYQRFIQQCGTLGINILNDENERMISPIYLRANFTQYKHIFKKIYESKVRICIIFLENPYAWHAIEGFYDAGFREGDMVAVFYSKTGGVQALSNELDEYIKKRKELMLGSLSVFSNEYIGDYGKQIKSEIAQAFYPQDPSYKCFSFDAFMLAAHGLDYTIQRGDDIENPLLLNKNLRKQRFVGCSGIISIESSSNNRNSAPINLFNFYYNATSSTYIEISVIVYNPESSTPFIVMQQIMWPGGTFIVPADMRDLNFDCPFDKKLVRLSGSGIGMLFGVCFSIFSISAFITWLIWKKWKIVDYPRLEKTKKLKFADMIVYLVIAIEFFQYLYLGPPVSSMNSAEAYMSDATSVDLSSFLTFKGTVFWITMIIALCVVLLSIFLNVFTVTRFKHFVKWKFCVNLRSFAEILMPLVGNAFFIPIISFLLNVFSCSHATGDSISDTYLDKDCYQYCWQEKHLAFAMLSVIAIFIYMPLTVYYRPVYQEVQESLNIKTMPKYLVIKSLIQIFFVVLKKTLGLYQPEIHGFVYMILFSVYIWVILRIKAYNYDRMCLLLFVTMLMIVWSVLFTSLANILEASFILWLCCQLTGWVAILIWGVLKAKKIPSLIITEKGIDISILFKFMLGKIEANQIVKKEIKFVSKKENNEQSKSKKNVSHDKIDEDKIEIVIEDDGSEEKVLSSENVHNGDENEEGKSDDTTRMTTNRKFI